MSSHAPHRTIVQERRHLIRAGLADLLADYPGIEVDGAVATAVELLAACETRAPDVVVLELEAPWDVQVLIGQLVALAPDVRVVALHHGRNDDHRRHADEVGVHALASYGVGTASIVAGIRQEPCLAFSSEDRRRPKGRATITPRELQVLRHLADGYTAAECAVSLGVSRKTVDNHKQRIFSKLNVQNQAHAVSLAHRMGLLGRPIARSAAGF
jgi:DNA-binding NarL/FixJ family response regulator